MFKKIQLYPFLIALYPILFLYAHNIDELFPHTLFAPTLISLLFCLILYIASYSLTKNHIKSSLISFVLILCFYIFGTVQDFFISFILPSKIIYLLFIVISFIYLVWRVILYYTKEASEERVKKLGLYIYALSGLFFLNIIASFFKTQGFKTSSLLILLLTVIALFGGGYLILKLSLNKIKQKLPGIQYFLVMFFLSILLYIVIYQSGFIKGITHRKLIPFIFSYLIFILVFNYYYSNRTIKKYSFIMLSIVVLISVFFLLFKYAETLFSNLIPELVISLAAISIVLKIIFSNNTLTKINQILNISLLILLFFPLFAITKYESSYWAKRQKISIPYIETTNDTLKEFYPVYYIVLDEYASTQTIKELFGYDNTPFVDSLREKGFYVNDWQTTSDLTQEVIAGVFNLGNFPHHLSGRDNFRGIQKNYTVSYFRKNGYKIIQYGVIRYENNFYFNDADSLINFPLIGIRARISDYTEKILYSSIIRRYVPQEKMFFRGVINNIFSTMPLIQGQYENEPFFVYAHLSSPHAPFVFDSTGNDIGLQTDGYKYYLGQYKYLNKRTIDLVNQLLAIHNGKCVIIIQSDHGPRKEETDIETTVEQKRQIFSALYFPDKNYKQITDSVCININTFAFVFNELFGAQFELKTKQQSSD